MFAVRRWSCTRETDRTICLPVASVMYSRVYAHCGIDTIDPLEVVDLTR